MKRSKMVTALISLFLLIFLVSCATASAGFTENQRARVAEIGSQSGTTLTAYVTAFPYWEIGYEWDIDKSVTPEVWDLFRGDSGTSLYTIEVTKSELEAENAWIAGEVCVTNGGGVATEDLKIVIDLYNGQPPPNDLIDSFELDISEKPVLEPGEEHCYEYIAVIPADKIFAGGTYKITSHVTITNHSGHLGEEFGPSPSETANLPDEPVETDGGITVVDTNGMQWEFEDSGTETYPMLFACDEDEGEHVNTATIYYSDGSTGPEDSATVNVYCYALDVSKDAETSYYQAWQWEITKTGDEDFLTLDIGETAEVVYEVTVTATLEDGGWMVEGEITVYNPAPMAATINVVTDMVSPNIEAEVECGVDFPYELAADSTLICTYSAELEDDDPRTNTATATLQNYDYDYELNPTLAGTTNFIGTAEVIFGEPSDVIDECITVTDSLYGELGTACAEESPKTFTYTLTVGPYEECGTFEFTNAASFVAGDSGATGSDSWTVMVEVPCLVGCTLSQGYWRTHSIYGPAPYDDTWAMIGEDTVFFLSGKTWYQVINTPPVGGNAYYILAPQYIAARLNIENGADASAIGAAMDWAYDFFSNYMPDDELDKDVRDEAIYYASILDQYNNGLIGPGKCDW